MSCAKEPHPADDLNGSDVARKLCILSRIIDAESLPELTEGFASVTTESLVPSALQDVASGSEFVQRMAEFDIDFENMRSTAQKEGKVLRFVALIDVEAGQVKAGLEKSVNPSDASFLTQLKLRTRYPFSHPFASSLSGSDNIVSFSTERYSPNPLIVQGSGACVKSSVCLQCQNKALDRGAAVTAMGCTADILKVLERTGLRPQIARL